MTSRRIFLIGPSGSGKSTLAAKLSAQLGLYLVSMDDFRMRLNRNVPYVQVGSQQVRAYESPVYFDANAIWCKLQAAIRLGQGFIAEGSHLLRYPAIADLAKKYDVEIFYLDVPHATSLDRRKRNNKGTLHDESFALIGESETAKHVFPQKAMPGVTVLDGKLPIAELLAAVMVREGVGA